MSYGLVGFLGGMIPIVIIAAVFFYVLWGVVRLLCCPHSGSTQTSKQALEVTRLPGTPRINLPLSELFPRLRP